jgi:hypothetical protein
MCFSSNNIRRTPETQPRQQPSNSENDNSNNANSRKRKRTNPPPSTDREVAHINLDKLPLQLLKDFNEAWKKADTMVPPSINILLIPPVSATNMYDIFGNFRLIE